MKTDDLRWEYQPLENPDWDYARNLFTVLKRPQATWSQSVFSARHENFIAPNRDYRYQGLCAFSRDEYWKFLDAVFFGIKGVRLEPKKVIASPWSHAYRYSGDGVDVDVSYFLCSDLKEGIAAKVVFDVRNSFMKELIIKPLVDIRNVCSDSNPEQTEVKIIKDCLVSSQGRNRISFFVKGSSIFASKDTLSWRYKLGSGFRENTSQGIKFVSEWARPVFVGEIHKSIEGNQRVSLLINCNRNGVDFDENEERSYVNQIAKKFNCKKEVLARIVSLDSFGVLENGLIIPEAGDFWFRKVWLRDLLESLINNFHTYVKLDEKKMGEMMSWLLKQQDKKTGMFPNFKNDYNAADTSLLFFILAEKYLKEFKDKTMERKILESFNLVLKKLSENKAGNNPFIHNHLLYCLPWYSWTDSRVPITGRMVSTRIPVNWINNESIDELSKPVLLPEINAMFIRFLKAGDLLGRDTEELYKKAVEKYRKTFLNDSFLYSMVANDKKDPTESSIALVSSVLLYNHVFDKKDLERMWPHVERLLVRREGKLFGMLCRNLGERAYYNDHQYHGAVVWPRDTPYLIKYLRIIGKNDLAKEILESNLEHQMKEGAIFYSNELFSLPEGRNPSPTETCSNPIPIKNPVQLWSNFCDDYLRE